MALFKKSGEVYGIPLNIAKNTTSEFLADNGIIYSEKDHDRLLNHNIFTGVREGRGYEYLMEGPLSKIKLLYREHNQPDSKKHVYEARIYHTDFRNMDSTVREALQTSQTIQKLLDAGFETRCYESYKIKLDFRNCSPEHPTGSKLKSVLQKAYNVIKEVVSDAESIPKRPE